MAQSHPGSLRMASPLNPQPVMLQIHNHPRLTAHCLATPAAASRLRSRPRRTVRIGRCGGTGGRACRVPDRQGGRIWRSRTQRTCSVRGEWFTPPPLLLREDTDTDTDTRGTPPHRARRGPHHHSGLAQVFVLNHGRSYGRPSSLLLAKQPGKPEQLEGGAEPHTHRAGRCRCRC
jgi:hypothetical protein